MARLTPYDLPFAMTVPATGRLAQGPSLDLRVWRRGVLGQAELDALSGVVTAWGILAQTSAMGGADIPASSSGIGDWSTALPAAGSVSWALSDVRVDEGAAVILAHMLYSEWDVVRFDRVELLNPAESQAVQPVSFDPKHDDPYPGIDRTIRFPYLLGDELMDDVAVRIRFTRTLDQAQQQRVDDALLTWGAVAAGGAYAIAPLAPLECSLVPDETLEWVDDEVEWALSKVRVHAGAFRGLVDVVAALDQRGIAVAELEIQ